MKEKEDAIAAFQSQVASIIKCTEIYSWLSKAWPEQEEELQRQLCEADEILRAAGHDVEL